MANVLEATALQPGREPAAPPAAPASAPDLVVVRHYRTGWLLRAGRIAAAAGLMAALFVGFELSLTSLAEQQAQQSLLGQFQAAIKTTTLDRANAVAAEGSPVAFISIQRLGLQQVVVEGTTPSDLKSGPGHVAGSPLPGEFGNAVIAGRRTTYGAPFGDLASLAKSDKITVTTGQGLFTYLVTSVEHVSSGQPDAVLGTNDSRLTLITSDPAFVPNGRLVVTAALQGKPDAVAQRPPVLVGALDLGLTGDALGLGLGIIWGELLVAAIWLALRLRRRWPANVVYLVAAPVLLALTVLTFTSFDLLLPGTL